MKFLQLKNFSNFLHKDIYYKYIFFVRKGGFIEYFKELIIMNRWNKSLSNTYLPICKFVCKLFSIVELWVNFTPHHKFQINSMWNNEDFAKTP